MDTIELMVHLAIHKPARPLSKESFSRLSRFMEENTKSILSTILSIWYPSMRFDAL